MTQDGGTRPAWYYAHAGQQAGPADLDALVQLAASGRLRPDDLVWTNGMPQWMPAGAIPVLASSFGQAAPAPQQPQQLQPPPIPTRSTPSEANSPGSAMHSAAALGYQGIQQPPYPGVPHQPGLGDHAATRWLLPVGRSGLAIAAGYLGLFSVLACPGPIALIVSILAIRDLRANPHKHGMGRAIFGLVMGVIGTGMLTFMAVSMAIHR